MIDKLKRFNSFSAITRIILIATAGFLFYGYLCRLAGIYFFWESKSIGWMLFWLLIIAILRDLIKDKKLQKKNTVFEKIGIGVSVFVIFMKSVMFLVVPQTSTYETAVAFIKTNAVVQKEVGTVNEIFVVPIGSISSSSNSQGKAGEADLRFIVKGSKKYMDLNVIMAKAPDTDWEIEISK